MLEQYPSDRGVLVGSPGKSTEQATSPTHRPLAAEQVEVGGELAYRLDLAVDHLIKRKDFICADMGWGADQFGRWLDAVATSGIYRGKGHAELADVVNRFSAKQQDVGSFFMPVVDGRTVVDPRGHEKAVQDHWQRAWFGQGRGRLGFLQAARRSGDERTRQAAERLGEFFLRYAPVESITQGDGDQVDVNFLFPFEARIEQAGGTVSIAVAGAWEDGVYKARIAVTPDAPRTFAVSVRIPRWAASATLAAPGVNESLSTAGHFPIRRRWVPGDVIEVTLRPEFHLWGEGQNGFNAKSRSALPGTLYHEAALTYGPFVLMVNRARNPEIPEGGYTLEIDRDSGGVKLLPPIGADAGEDSRVHEPLRPPVRYRARIRTSAGSGDTGSAGGDAAGAKTVPLTPMSEMTGFRSVGADTYRVRHNIWVCGE